jgi:hypothetical protein
MSKIVRKSRPILIHQIGPSLRREKEAFEFLIKEKSSLVLPELVDEDLAVEDYGIKNNAVTRKAGGSLAS